MGVCSSKSDIPDVNMDKKYSEEKSDHISGKLIYSSPLSRLYTEPYNKVNVIQTYGIDWASDKLYISLGNWISVHNSLKFEQIHKFEQYYKINVCFVNQRMKRIYFVNWIDAMIYIHDLETMKRIGQFKCAWCDDSLHKIEYGRYSDALISHDEKYIIVIDYQNLIRVFDVDGILKKEIYTAELSQTWTNALSEIPSVSKFPNKFTQHKNAIYTHSRKDNKIVGINFLTGKSAEFKVSAQINCDNLLTAEHHDYLMLAAYNNNLYIMPSKSNTVHRCDFKGNRLSYFECNLPSKSAKHKRHMIIRNGVCCFVSDTNIALCT